MDDDLLTSTEAAQLMGVTRQTVERWVRENGLRAKVEVRGRRKVYRFRRIDLRDFARRWLDERWT